MSRKLVFILGTGHCGSTLLDMILSSHSQAFGLGETRSLARYEHFFTGERPVSNLHGFDDTFWTPGVLRDLRPLFRADHVYAWRLAYRLLPFLNRDRDRLYRYLFDRSGAQVLVDSSKGIGWAREFVRQNRGGIDPVLVWLHRDPRAVVASYRRKDAAVPVEKVAAKLRRQHDAFQAFLAGWGGLKARVSYEQLATEPETVIRGLCELLGIEYEPEMLEYWRFEHHHIAGNAGTKALVRKFQLGTDEALIDARFNYQKDVNRDHYRKHELAIQLDERWRTELSRGELDTVEQAFAGVDEAGAASAA